MKERTRKKQKGRKKNIDGVNIDYHGTINCARLITSTFDQESRQRLTNNTGTKQFEP